jgi:DnaJ-class molecular chaperone
MTPAAIRAALKQTHFSVICDSCHGRLFRNGILCGKCDGEGRVLIPERRITVYVSPRLLKSAVILGVAICLLVGAVISILR